jgi:hypothetical protein
MTTKITDKRDRWQFVIETDARSWVWERTRADGTVERSVHGFGSLHECAADAGTHGYGEWKNDERRQVTPGVDALVMVD